MEDFLDQGLSKSQLEHLNTCRMYLQVTTLSELTNHTEMELLPQILTNRLNPLPKGLANISQSTLTWPHIHPPCLPVGDYGPQPYAQFTWAQAKLCDWQVLLVLGYWSITPIDFGIGVCTISLIWSTAILQPRPLE